MTSLVSHPREDAYDLYPVVRNRGAGIEDVAARRAAT